MVCVLTLLSYGDIDDFNRLVSPFINIDSFDSVEYYPYRHKRHLYNIWNFEGEGADKFCKYFNSENEQNLLAVDHITMLFEHKTNASLTIKKSLSLPSVCEIVQGIDKTKRYPYIVNSAEADYLLDFLIEN